MRHELMWDLADCTEFRQTLQARPPRIVHGTLLLLGALLATGLAWAALTHVDLVVRAPGRVRPVASPMKVVNAGSGEVLSATTGGRVVVLNTFQGQEVRRGDILIQLDTERLDNEMAKRQRAIQAGEEELTELARLDQLLAQQFTSTRAKAEAELAQAQGEIRQAIDRQAADVRLAEQELQNAQDEESQVRQLVAREFVPRDDLRKASARLRDAKARLDKARLPLDTGGVEVLRRALALVERDHAVRRQELYTQRRVKQADVEALRIELANLKLAHEQSVIRAPIDGIVTTGDVKVGDILESGKPVIEIAELKGFRFEAAVPSEEMGHLRIGMEARIKLDAYEYQRYGTAMGTVTFIAPDSNLPAGQGTVSYLVRIELTGEELGRGDFRGRIKLGMAGQADIITGQESILSLLVLRIRQTISLG